MGSKRRQRRRVLSSAKADQASSRASVAENRALSFDRFRRPRQAGNPRQQLKKERNYGRDHPSTYVRQSCCGERFSSPRKSNPRHLLVRWNSVQDLPDQGCNPCGLPDLRYALHHLTKGSSGSTAQQRTCNAPSLGSNPSLTSNFMTIFITVLVLFVLATLHGYLWSKTRRSGWGAGKDK